MRPTGRLSRSTIIVAVLYLCVWLAPVALHENTKGIFGPVRDGPVEKSLPILVGHDEIIETRQQLQEHLLGRPSEAEDRQTHTTAH